MILKLLLIVYCTQPKAVFMTSNQSLKKNWFPKWYISQKVFFFLAIFNYEQPINHFINNIFNIRRIQYGIGGYEMPCKLVRRFFLKLVYYFFLIKRMVNVGCESKSAGYITDYFKAVYSIDVFFILGCNWIPSHKSTEQRQGQI